MGAYGACVAARAFLPLCTSLLLLAGCATRVNGPQDVSPGIYMMSGTSLSLMASTNDVVTDIQRHASSFCASSGDRAVEVVRVDTVAPELVRFPEGRLQFRCVVRRAQDATSTSIGPM